MLSFTADRLTIGDLRRTDIGLDLEFPLQTVDQNVEVKLAHSLHDRLTGLDVRLDAEGRVFGGKPLKTLATSSPDRPWSWARPQSR